MVTTEKHSPKLEEKLEHLEETLEKLKHDIVEKLEHGMEEKLETLEHDIVDKLEHGMEEKLETLEHDIEDKLEQHMEEKIIDELEHKIEEKVLMVDSVDSHEEKPVKVVSGGEDSDSSCQKLNMSLGGSDDEDKDSHGV